MKPRHENLNIFVLFKRLMPFVLRDQPLWFWATLIIGTFHGLSHAYMTVILQQFIDAVNGSVIQGTVLTALYWTAAGLVMTIVGIEVLNGLHNFLAGQYYLKMNGSLGKRINMKASRIEPICYEDPELLNDINKANAGMVNSIDLLFTLLTIITVYIPYFIFLGVYLYLLHPILVVSLVLIFVPVLITQFLRVTIFAKLEDQSAPVRREYEYLEKCIGDQEYYKETRLLGSFRFFRELYETALILLGKHVWRAQSRIGLLELSTKLLTLAGYMGVLFMLFRFLMSGTISIGAFAAVFASIDKMFGLMQEMITTHIARLNTNLATVKNFIRFLDLPERRGRDLPLQIGEGIKLTDVTFR